MPSEHSFRRVMTLPLPRKRVFAFFADPANLARITPAEMGFEILTPMPVEMDNGLIIDYRVRIAGMPFHWQSLITHWDPPSEFDDEQMRGPYRRWSHAHRFRDVSEGTEIEDDVRYALPFWPLGELAHPFVRNKLESIFHHREVAIRRILL